jgi:hypothetical protein
MELIRDVTEFISAEGAEIGATLFPFAALGLLGLYILWLVIGYLRVSQVGLADNATAEPVLALTSTDESSRPRGVPYCAFDGLQYPFGARYCTSCERDLLLDCVNDGATLFAGDASCYRCGTRTGAAEPAALG